MNARFARLTLRTTDVAGARAFYAAVLGDASGLEIFPLHEQAIARGARPHWLGQIGVDDVEAAVAAFVARGALRYGPTATFPDGRPLAVVRDPGEAVVGLTSPCAEPLSPEVAWCVLNTTDLARAEETYRALFGWKVTERLDAGEMGVFDHFAFEPGGPSVGSFSDIGSRPGVHPHWLFDFRVADFDRAVAAVRAGGGLVVGPFDIPSGGRLAVCDDPQGAAFALRVQQPLTGRA